MDKLTKKQKGFVKEYIDNGENATQAIIDAKYKVKDRIVAKSMGAENLAKPYIKEVIEKEKKTIAEQIPDDKLVKVHLEGLEAGKHIYKNNNESGEIEDMGVEPDYPTRHKYMESGYKLKGAYAPDKSINININQEQTPEQLAKAKIFDEWWKKQQTQSNS